MRRWIAVFFLLLLPLQAVWAAAAQYCPHEKEAQSFHLGHHTHEHQGEGDAGEPDKPLPAMEDGDCHVCHAFCSAMYSDTSRVAPLAIAPTPAPTPAFALPTPPQAQPDRPNWIRFA